MRRAALLVIFAACSFDEHGVSLASAIDAAHESDAAADTRPDGAIDARPDADPCPGGYTPLAGAEVGSQYKLVIATRKWLDAEQACEADGLAHLVVLDSDGELDAVRGAIKGDVWVGVSDLVTEGTYAKVTGGAATYLPWLPGEPNNSGGNEDCIELKDGGFNDDDCTKSEVSVCECDGHAAVPAAYTP